MPRIEKIVQKEVEDARELWVGDYTNKIYDLHSDLTKLTRQHHDNSNAPHVVKEINEKRKVLQKSRDFTNSLRCQLQDLQGPEIGL